MEDGPSAWAPELHVADTDEAPGVWLLSLATAAAWGVTQQVSTCLSPSL